MDPLYITTKMCGVRCLHGLCFVTEQQDYYYPIDTYTRTFFLARKVSDTVWLVVSFCSSREVHVGRFVTFHMLHRSCLPTPAHVIQAFQFDCINLGVLACYLDRVVVSEVYSPIDAFLN